MDKSNDADLVPLAILITLIYENKDAELLSIANKIIARNGTLVIGTIILSFLLLSYIQAKSWSQSSFLKNYNFF